MSKYVLVKGRFGMGGRISTLVGAIAFANRTGRELVVDWCDYYYNDIEDFDIVNKFYPDISGVKNFYKNIFNLNQSIYPNKWTFENLNTTLNLPSEFFTDPPPATFLDKTLENVDIIVVTWPDPNLEHEKYIKILKNLRVSDVVLDRVNSFMEPYTDFHCIGIHYRHGGGENHVIPPNPIWFFNKIDCLLKSYSNSKLFLFTDSNAGFTTFSEKYKDILFLNKSFPEMGPLHNNALDNYTKFNNGLDALVDLYSLARCRSIVDSGEFYSNTSYYLSNTILIRNTYPGKTRSYQNNNALNSNHILSLINEIKPLKSVFDKIRVGNNSKSIVIDNCFNNIKNVIIIGRDFDENIYSFFNDHGINVSKLPISPEFEDAIFKGEYDLLSASDILDVLSVFLNENNFSEVFLYLDLMGYERVLLSKFSLDLMKSFKLIYCRLFSLEKIVDYEFFDMVFNSILTLTNSHTVTHLHPNNVRPVTYIHGIPIPTSLSLTLLRKDLSEFFEFNGTIPSDLDVPSDPNSPVFFLRSW